MKLSIQVIVSTPLLAGLLLSSCIRTPIDDRVPPPAAEVSSASPSGAAPTDADSPPPVPAAASPDPNPDPWSGGQDNPADESIRDGNGRGEQDPADLPAVPGSLRYLAVHGSGIYSPEDLDLRSAFPEHTRYPRLGGVFYSQIKDEPAFLEILSRFDLLVVGTSVCLSSGIGGGVPLGKWRGEGNNRNVVYDLNRISPDLQKIVTGARRMNPGLRFLVQASLSHLEAVNFRYGTSSPGRFFADNVSPKYFAYTPFLELLEPVPSDSSVNVFRFDPASLKKGLKKIKFRTGSGEWTRQNAYDWTYCCFYDNDNGGTRGNFEIMAVAGIDAEKGLIRVAVKGKQGRTLMGTPQGYPAGARFGFLNSSNRGFGALSFYMNRTPACEAAGGEGGPLNWTDYLLRYMKRFVLPSRYKGRYLAAGLIADADKENADTLYSWRFLHPRWFFTDFNLDGNVDDPIEASRAFMEGMKIYVRGIRRAAEEIGRKDLVFVKNGAFFDPLNREANGRFFEDFNGFFQDASVPLAEKRYIELFRRGRMAEPVIAVVNERDTKTTPVSTNWAAHRHTMAFTCIAGEGYYAMTGPFSIGFKIQKRQDADRWYDEYSVDGAGTGCNHPDYRGDTPASGRGWLGRPVTQGVKLAPRTYAREFENGIVLCTGKPGGFAFDLEALFPGARFRRIKGADDSAVNSGADTGKSIRIARHDGIFLVRVEENGTLRGHAASRHKGEN